MNIIVTLPSTIEWDDYKEELDAVADGKGVLNFKVPMLPTKCSPGDRCYILWRGKIRGWMPVVGFRDGEFTCDVTGIRWKGKFIQRSGKFQEIDGPEMEGFRGFRYADSSIES